MYLDFTNRNPRGYIQIWILIMLTGLLLATSFGLLLTLNDDPEKKDNRSDQVSSHHRADLFDRSSYRPDQPRRIKARRNAQEAIQRYWTLLEHIRRSQEQPRDNEQDNGPQIPVKVKGSAHKKIAPQMEQTLQGIGPSVSKCYQMRLRHKPHLRGKVFFSFTLIPDQLDEYGAIGKAHVADSKVRDFRLEACILKALSSAEFPISFADADTDIRERWYHYNFDLQPAG